jgi:transglutaminase-like putative cysteine protease
MLKRLTLATLLFLLFLSLALYGQDSAEVRYKRIYDFKIEKKGKKFKLTSRISHEYVYLTESPTLCRWHYIYEPYFAPVEKIKAHFRNKKIKDDYRSWDYATDENTFMTDNKIHTIVIPDEIKAGDKFTLSYMKKYIDIAYMPLIEIPNINFVERFRIKFTHPKEVKVNFEIFFPGDKAEYKIDSIDEKMTTLTFFDIPFSKYVDDYYFTNIFAFILPEIEYDGRQLIPTSETDFVNWYGTLVNLEPELDKEYSAFLADTLDDSTSNIEKLAIINGFVRDNIRYIADKSNRHSFIPHDPLLTLTNRYGDCTDKAALVTAIARNVGINVRMALVYNRPRPDMEGIHRTDFDHVICYYEDDKDSIFFDPTARYCDFGNLPQSLVDSRALILDPVNPRLRVIEMPNNEAMLELLITSSLDFPDGGLAKICLRNDYLIEGRKVIETMTQNVLESLLIGFIGSHFHKISLSDINFKEKKDDAIIFEAKADISEFIISSTENKYIPKEPFALATQGIISRADDNFPIHLSRTMKLLLSLNLDCTGFAVSSDSLILDDFNHHYFASRIVAQDSGNVNINYEYNRTKKTFSSETKSDCLGFARSYSKNKTAMYTLTGRDK